MGCEIIYKEGRKKEKEKVENTFEQGRNKERRCSGVSPLSHDQRGKYLIVTLRHFAPLSLFFI